VESIATPSAASAPRTRLEQRQQAQAQAAAAAQASAPEPEPVKSAPAPAMGAVPPELQSALGELENTLSARFYDASLNMIREIPVRDMIKSLEELSEVGAVVFDGIVTQRLADLVEQKKAKVLVGIKMGNVSRKPTGLLVYTKA